MCFLFSQTKYFSYAIQVLQEPAKVHVRGRKSQHTKKLQKTLAEVASQRKHQIATAVSSFPAVRRINVKSKKKSSSRQVRKNQIYVISRILNALILFILLLRYLKKTSNTCGIKCFTSYVGSLK